MFGYVRDTSQGNFLFPQARGLAWARRVTKECKLKRRAVQRIVNAACDFKVCDGASRILVRLSRLIIYSAVVLYTLRNVT